MPLPSRPQLKQIARRRAEQLVCQIGVYRPARRVYQQVFNRAYYQERLLSREAYRAFVPQGALVFDIGANEGRMTELFAELGARVVAVEPTPELAQRVRARYGSTNVVVEPKAVGAEPGVATLHLGVDNGHSTLSSEWHSSAVDAQQRWNGAVEVAVTTIDELVARHGSPAFVKIDVEGFEAQVLAGMTRPVAALSFEFLCDAIDIAHNCIARLEELGGYEYNIARAEHVQTRLATWVSGTDILSDLAAFRAEGVAGYGDVYARQRAS